MMRVLAFVLLFAQTAVNPIPATDVKSSDIQTVLKRVMVNLTAPVSDTPVRTVDAGGPQHWHWGRISAQRRKRGLRIP